MCSETSEAVGTTWEHAQLEFQNFLKIRIPLLPVSSYTMTGTFGLAGFFGFVENPKQKFLLHNSGL